jgi:phage tail sheath gpL-like
MVQNISFPNYVSSNRVPGDYVDFDSSRANTARVNQRALLIGQKTTTGNATLDMPFIVSSFTDAATKVGVNSMLYDMITTFRDANTFQELWALPVTENGAGTAGTGTVTFTGTATAAGTLNLYVGDTNIQVGISSGDTAAGAATKLVAAMTNYPYLPATAAAVAGVVTFTAVHKGIAASDLPISVNWRGSANGEVTPAGLTVAVVGMNAGTADPVLDTALANLSSMAFDFIVCPYTSSAALTSIKNFLSDSSGRWAWTSMLYGICFNAVRGTFGATVTFGLSQNDKHISTLPILNSPTPVWAAATNYAAVCGASINGDPALPLTQLPLVDILPPTIDQQLTLSEANTFLYSGISTFTVSSDGVVNLQRSVTNYQKNGAGIADNSYLDTETDAVLMYYARDLVADLSSTFARKKLVNDGSISAAGSNTVTPNIILQHVIGHYGSKVNEGIVQDAPTFAKTARAQNAGGGQVSLYLPIILANQLRTIAMNVSFVKP